jgi:ribonuclease HI
MVTRRNKSPN